MSAPPEKRPRLSTSCNWCRSHKLKCDTEQPSCLNCRRRNIECVTTDLRKPGSVGRRVQPVGRYRKRLSNNVARSHDRSQSNASSVDPSLSDNVQTWTRNEPSLAVILPPVKANSSILRTTAAPESDANATSDKPIFSLPFNLHDQEHDGSSIARTYSNGSSPLSYNGGHETSRSGDEHTSGGTDLTMLTDDSPGRLQMMGNYSLL